MSRYRSLGTLALSVGILALAACASHPSSMLPPESVQARHPGALAVPVRLPALGARSVQYTYNNGYINALEVMVVDSLGNHQAFVICRNPSSVGSPGGLVNVLFQNVAPGTAWITVRTTYKQLVGPGLMLAPTSPTSATFTLNGGPNAVTAVQGDLTSSVLVFKSTDLGGTPSAPSVLSFYQNNGASELNDTTSTNGGYGVGAATGSVVPGNTATVSIAVSQPGAFASSLLGTTRQIDAGNPVTIPVSNLYPGDRVVVVRAGAPSPTSDFLDLTKTTDDFYPITDNGDGTGTFTPTRSTAGAAVAYYLSRGETLSLVGATPPSVSLAQLNVHPSVVSPPNCTTRIGSDDGLSTLARSAGATDTVYLTLRDRFNNLITSSDFGARTMAGFAWRPTVEPSFTALNNGTNPVAFVPGLTVGTVTTPVYDPVSQTWQSTFTQGATPATATGATASFSVGAATNVTSASYLYDPSNVTGTATYVLGVGNDPTITNSPQRLWVSLYRTSVAGANFIASTSYQPLVTVAAGATLSLTPSAPSGPAMMLRLTTKANTDLAAADNGTTLSPTVGTRSAGDTDRATFRIYQPVPGGALALKASLVGGTYSWQP